MPSKTITVRHVGYSLLYSDVAGTQKKKEKIHPKQKKSYSAYLWHSFRQTRNEYTYEFRKRKLEYLEELDEQASCNENWKKIAGNLSSISCQRKFVCFSTNNINPLDLDAGGKILYSSKEKAIVSNTFFKSQSGIEGNDDEAKDKHLYRAPCFVCH